MMDYINTIIIVIGIPVLLFMFLTGQLGFLSYLIIIVLGAVACKTFFFESEEEIDKI